MKTASDYRKFAFLSAAAGVLFLVVAFFGRGQGWRGALPAVAGVLWLIIAAQQFRNARRAEPPSSA